MGKDRPTVSGLEVVDVRSVSVHFGMNAVSGAVNEVVGISGGANDVPANVVHLPSKYGSSCGEGLFDESGCRVSRISNNSEHLADFFGNRGARKGRPCDVSING